ncbi:PGPGW domain-containing protein [Nitrosomonas sp. Nm34]|uniref:PGPGW domain-containing protein n=1 Tax=Nitrosomonas sp. Nm34 TaxID=1881055 RepID=UPI0008E37EEC|nr:PGPGW domain-containing protein [Nitrosomonas sp. Nm34]SFI22209.1 Putative transmembrane protein (PGPGW) [Nitrosomonas sp. Nm34]
MSEVFEAIQQWIPAHILISITIASIIGFIGTLIAIPIILIRLPADYFDTRTPRHWMKNHHPVLRILGLIIKNLVGSVFVLAGFIMLFVPGQGLLTMLIGISLLDFPKKRELEARIVSQPSILKAINSIRHKFNKPSLILAPRS